MKRFFILMSLVLGAFALTGCNTSNIEESPVKKGNFSFTVNMDSMTRATVEKSNVVFNVGDKVAFGAAEHAGNDTVTKAMIAEYSNNDGKFYCDTVLDDTKSFDFYALWPYQAGSKGAQFNLPAKLKNPNQYSTYIYVGKNAFSQIRQNIDSAMQYAPMIGINTAGSPAIGASVDLHHLASMLEFNVKNATTSPVRFSSLKMTVGDGTKFCGTYYVDMTTGELTPSGANYVYDNCTVTIEGGSDEYQPGTGHLFFMPIAPVTIAAGTAIEFEITTVDGEKCNVTKHIPATASVTFEAGKWNTLNIDYTGPNATYYTLAQVLDACSGLVNTSSGTGTSTDSYDVNDAVVVAQNGRNVIVSDGTAYMLLYRDTNTTLSNGDVISISGKVQNYFGILEWTSPTVTKTGTTEVTFPTPVTYTDALFNSYKSAPTVQYVKVSGACTVDGKKIDIAGSTVQLYYTYTNTGVSFEGFNGKDVVCEGFLYGYNNNSSKASFLATSVAEDSSAPSLTLDPETLQFRSDECGPDDYKAVTATVVNTTITEITDDATWCLAEQVGNTIYVSVLEQNTTGATRTATVTVTTAAGISKTVTVTQAPAAVTGMTIAQVLSSGAGTYSLTGVTVYAFNNYTPSGGTATPNNVIVGDATGFMLVYRPVVTTATQGLAVGSVVDISGPVVLYENTNSGNKIYEFSGTTDNPVNLAITGSSTPSYPTPVTFSHSDFASYFSGVATVQYVAVDGVYSSAGVTTSDGDIYYTANSIGVSFSGMTDKPVNCKGFVYGFSNTSGKISYLVTDVQEDTSAPTLSVSPASLSFTADESGSTSAKAIECTVNNTTLSNATSDASWLHVELAVTHVGATVYPTSANTSTSSRTATVTITTASGLSKTVSVTQYGKSSGTAKFVKVTSTSDLTDGDYLIVYEGGNIAFNGALTTLDAVSNTISVTISSGEIAANDATNGAVFTYNSTDKTLRSASGYYIGQTSDANGLLSNTATKYTNTITISSGDADIASSGNAHLRYNANSGQERFRYYKSSSYTNQKAIQLYKKTN